MEAAPRLRSAPVLRRPPVTLGRIELLSQIHRLSLNFVSQSLVTHLQFDHRAHVAGSDCVVRIGDSRPRVSTLGAISGEDPCCRPAPVRPGLPGERPPLLTITRPLGALPAGALYQEGAHQCST